MAESDLIDGYVANLRGRLRRRPDADDVLDEVRDHLREAVAGLRAAGVDEAEAQRRVLCRFGDPELIGRVLSAPTSGGVVMPSTFTRSAGAVAILATGLWAAAAVLKWWESGLFAPWDQQRYVVFSVIVAAASIASVVVMAGVLARAGWPSPTTPIAFVLAAGALVGLIGVPWMWPVLGLLLGGAYLITLVAAARTTGRRGLLAWASAAAWPAGFLTFALLSAIGVGPVDEYGGYPLSLALGFTVAAAGMVVGSLDIGRWLVTERVAPASAVPVS